MALRRLVITRHEPSQQWHGQRLWNVSAVMDDGRVVQAHGLSPNATHGTFAEFWQVSLKLLETIRPQIEEDDPWDDETGNGDD